MRWVWVAAAGFALLAVALVSPGLRFLGLVGAGLALAAAGWRLSRCAHPGPLGLLPPVTNPDGTRTAPHWFCGACGKSWPTSFEHDQRPVPRFEGYDETKAAQAARRAEELEKRQRALAVRRAGLAVSRRSAAVGPVAQVVQMNRARRFGSK